MKEKDPKRVAAGKHARNKGSSFERDIARLVSKLFFGTEEELKRTPRSGASPLIFGDCYYPAAPLDFPLIIECKKEEGWEFHHIFSDSSLIWNWWRQVYEDYTQCLKTTGRERIPVVIFSKNHYPVFILADSRIDGLLEIKDKVIYDKADSQYTIGPFNEENVKCNKNLFTSKEPEQQLIKS